MNTAINRRIANINNPREVLSKAIRWVGETGASFFVSSSCTEPLLMTYRRTQNANFWVVISLDMEDGYLDFTVSNGLKIPTAFIPKAHEFLKAIYDIEPTSVELQPRYSEIRSSQAIELSENELDDDDITCAFEVACKEVDDCTLPLLSMIYGSKTVADAVTDYQVNQKISLFDWSMANIEVPQASTCERNSH